MTGLFTSGKVEVSVGTALVLAVWSAPSLLTERAVTEASLRVTVSPVQAVAGRLTVRAKLVELTQRAG